MYLRSANESVCRIQFPKQFSVTFSSDFEDREPLSVGIRKARVMPQAFKNLAQWDKWLGGESDDGESVDSDQPGRENADQSEDSEGDSAEVPNKSDGCLARNRTGQTFPWVIAYTG